MVMILALCAGQAGWAQTAPTQQSIQAQLQGPFLMLRGMYGRHKLRFDAQGNLIGSADTLPFSLSAVRLDSIHVTQSEVELDATREGLEFPSLGTGHVARQPEPTVWNNRDQVRIVIARDDNQPAELNTALDKIFAKGFDRKLADTAPKYWRLWLRHEYDPATQLGPGPKEKREVLAAQQPPVLLHSVAPRTSTAARKVGYSGISTIGFIIDTNGMPTDIRIIKPLGMGLDQEAVDAASHFRFRPARRDGQPVPVFLELQMRFHR